MDPDHRGFPHSKEKPRCWLGRTQVCGDVMTFWILTQDTNEVIARSVIRSAEPNTEDKQIPSQCFS